ncbi:MAG TPA: PAS domain S-box protein, partial [Dehalococcoidia bacterium]
MKVAAERTEVENLFETLASKSPVGLYIVQDGKFYYTNHAFQSTTGYTEDELLGRDALGLVIPEDREGVRENAIKMLKGKRTSPYQFRVTRKNGSIKWIMESVVSIQYRGRRATLGNFIDITERKQAEEALRAERNKLQALIDAMEYNISIQDTEFNIIYQNEPSRIASGDHLGEKCYRAYESRKKVCDGCPVEEVFKDGKSHTAERRMVTPSGKVIFMESTATPIRDAGGRIVSCLEIVRNITAHKQAEEARREAEEEKSALLEEAPVAIMHVDLKGKITYVNKRFESESGYSREEIVGKNGFRLDWFPARTMKYFAKRMAARLIGSPAKHWKTQFKCKDGRWIWVELEGNVLRRLGVPVGFQIIARNITERKQAEEKVQHLNLVLRAIRNVNQLIASGTDRDGLLKGACDTLVKTRGYYSAWIALLDGSGKLVTAAEAGLGKSFLQVMERLKRGELTHCGCKVLGKPGVLVIKDVSSECEDCPLAKKDTGRDAISVRLEYGGKVYGLMTVSIPPGRAAEKEEQDLLKEVAQDIAFALYSMEQEQERKRMEEALQDSEEKLRKMFESVTDGISVIDLKGIITEVNQRAVEMHGFSSKDELRGKSAIDLVAPRDHKRVAAAMKKTIKQEAIRRAECTLLRADGSEFPGELSTSVLKDASGNLVGHITIARNITERKQAEEALQAEKNKLQSLIDAMEDHLTIRDKDYNLIYQGEPSKKIFGDHMGEKCYRVYGGREEVCEGCPVEKAFIDGKSHTTERKTITPPGDVIFWENTANPIRDAEGRIVACLELARDITERKQAEEALQAEKNKLQSLIDAMEDTITIQDTEYNITSQNEPSRRASGGD